MDVYVKLELYVGGVCVCVSWHVCLVIMYVYMYVCNMNKQWME